MQWESGYKDIFPCSTWNTTPQEGYGINLFMWTYWFKGIFLSLMRHRWFTGIEALNWFGNS